MLQKENPCGLGAFENLVVGGRREKRYTQKHNSTGLFVKLKTVLRFSVLVRGYGGIFGSEEPSCDRSVTPKTAKMARGLLNSGSFYDFNLIDSPPSGAWICSHPD